MSLYPPNSVICPESSNRIVPVEREWVWGTIMLAEIDLGVNLFYLVKRILKVNEIKLKFGHMQISHMWESVTWYKKAEIRRKKTCTYNNRLVLKRKFRLEVLLLF